MTLKLAVTVAVDMDATAVTLRGPRTRRMLPGFTVRLDPGLLKEVFPEALHSLTDAGVMTSPARQGEASKDLRRPRPGLGLSA